MRRNPDAPYLRVVDPILHAVPTVTDDPSGALLGFVDMSSISDDGFERIISTLRPAWVFDVRSVPYFDVGRLNRRRIFELFQDSGASYRDICGALQITRRNDASLNSGAVGSFLNDVLATKPRFDPVLVLVDDEETREHAMSVLPTTLRSHADGWSVMAVRTNESNEGPDVLFEDRIGRIHALQAKWIGDPSLSPEYVVEGFRLWRGDEMFAVTFGYEDGHAAQVALPLDCRALLDKEISEAVARSLAMPKGAAPESVQRGHKLIRDKKNEVAIVALRVTRVRVREGLDGRSILLSFEHPGGDATHAIFSIDGAQLLRANLQGFDQPISTGP